MEADGLEPRCDFVDRQFPWQVFAPLAVRGGAVLRGELHLGDEMCEGLLVGAFLCGWWGRRLEHLVVRLLWRPRFLQSCADSGEDVLKGGRGGGVWCQIAPGEVVTRRVLGILLYGDAGGGVVLRSPPLWVVVQGMQGDGMVMLPAVESKEGVEAVPGVSGRAGIV